MRMFFFYLGVVASAARAGDELSFAAPFDAVAATGDRQVSPAWRAHGSAAVHRNFARQAGDTCRSPVAAPPMPPPPPALKKTGALRAQVPKKITHGVFFLRRGRTPARELHFAG